MRNVLALLCAALALWSCASSPETPPPVKPVATQRQPPAPPPAAVMQPRPANYLPRLCAIFSSLSATQIEMCASLPPAKQP